MIYLWVVSKNATVVNVPGVKENQPNKNPRRIQKLLATLTLLKVNLKVTKKKSEFLNCDCRDGCISLESSRVAELPCNSAALFKVLLLEITAQPGKAKGLDSLELEGE